MESQVSTSKNVTILTRGDTTYYIIGTAHVSQASVEEVRRLIEEVQPDTVCVELCQARYNALVNQDGWKNLDIFKVIREGKTLYLLANLALSAYQRRIGDQLGVKPGAEILAAVNAAKEQGAKVELIDRDIHVTLKRTWANVGFWKKNVLLSELIMSVFSGSGGEEISAGEIEKLKEQANLSDMLSEFTKALPEVKKPLIDERDQYLISGVEKSPGKRIVAVVGAAHVPGMKENFGRPVDRAALESLPPPSKLMQALKWLIPALILLAFLYGFSMDETSKFENMVYAWVLASSIMASVFTTAAGGKILSILTAGVVSPLTTLHPLLAAGMFVGLVEAWLRKPTVEDCERIHEDVRTVRGFYRNPVTRILLVALMANIGAALGAWIGSTLIVRSLLT